MSGNPKEKSSAERYVSEIENVLTELTGMYGYDGEQIPVKLSSRSCISTTGEKIFVNKNFGLDLSGPQKLRVWSDTVSHERYHANESDLESRKRFAEEHDVAPNIAGTVMNIVEDRYIDAQRVTDWHGQKLTSAFVLMKYIESDANPKFNPIHELPRVRQLLYGLMQVSSLGFLVDYDSSRIDDEIEKFLVWARLKLNDVEEMSPENEIKRAEANGETISEGEAMERAQERRWDAAEEIFEAMMGHIDNAEQADSDAGDNPIYVPGEEVPEDADPRPMTPEEKEEFEKAKKDIPDMDIDDPPDDADADADGSSISMPAPDSQGDEEDEDAESDGSGDDSTSTGESGEPESQDPDSDADEPNQDGESGEGSDSDDDGDSPESSEDTQSSGSGTDQSVTCPSCDSTNTDSVEHTVEGMVAARVNSPFDPDAAWVGRSTFISNDELCGFRVEPTGEVPSSTIESEGYKIIDVPSGVEILEPKTKYGDTEEISGYICHECGYEWVPGIGGVNQ